MKVSLMQLISIINARMLMSKIGYQPFLTIQFYMAGVLIPQHTRDIHYVNFASWEPGK